MTLEEPRRCNAAIARDAYKAVAARRLFQYQGRSKVGRDGAYAALQGKTLSDLYDRCLPGLFDQS